MRRALIAVLWMLASVVIVFLITLPISLQAHLIAGSIVVLAMILLKTFGPPTGVFRVIALALGTAIVLRYVYWRTTSTLPPINQIEDFIPGFMLYIAEMYSVFMLFLSLFVVSSPVPPRPTPPLPANVPTVDVFIPTYNEDMALLANTVAAAKGMDYPADKLTVWLLDDGGTDQKCNQDNAAKALEAQQRRRELSALCEGLGARYLTRARNEHAKAGNMNNGLEHSTGDLVVVFDADHAPARTFLKETVGHFAQDENLFLVQTPHFFINPDPLERNLDTFDVMPSENEMFYGIIQRGLDKWDASFFCGSAAVLRRAALKETNGFSGVTITEDCETALGLHSRGWRSIYVEKPLIAGLQPESFASFIGQRSRWAQGMMQILIFHVPFFKRGLSLPQRLCYMSSMLFWLFPYPRLMFLVSPLFYLFFSLEVFNASGAEFLAYTSTYMLVNLLMQNYLYGRYRWPWISELYEYIQSIYLLPAILSVIANPRKPTFNVTSKGENIHEGHVSEIGRPFFIIFAVLVAALIVSIYRALTEPFNADVIIVVGGWNVLNLLIAGCALGVVSERRNRRRTHRVNLQRRCEIIIDAITYAAMVEDGSTGGARIRLAEGVKGPDFERGQQAQLRFTPHADIGPDVLPLSIRNIEHDKDGVVFGCQFEPQTPTHYRLVADLIFANADEWRKFQESRRKNPGVLLGTLRFIRQALYHTGRGLSYLVHLQRLWRERRRNPLFAAAKRES
ncbi:UDP-forming cellulose synthase catalytic subunit [Ancylobacter defluvii]|uniref:Cellulose synthase catalytic subunit [UDP-forming] n=1 Tax=Ancylobacter defluvii TaxID=1282440 RepID=A0A9W6NDQ8_9HYPH|nr:UDP-forming cellulose synthase catalytic subunit [Ancylobacter defluvii]MBS7588817.1 UDP-forming cellulose synthase catalytic subunit [Ancylobacter defluvii]GLK86907.1 cellulose synthase catalytic subunit (UDP-forming) [Ancylobacter defluvii]